MQFILLNSFYDVYIPYETIKEVVEKSEFYQLLYLFRKAVDLLDWACVYSNQNRGTDRSRPVPTITPKIINYVLTEKLIFNHNK